MIAALLLAAAMGPRTVSLQVCNDTTDTAFFAVAYEASGFSRRAEGWTQVAPGRCNVREHVTLGSGSWFSYYVFTRSGKNYRAGPHDFGELVCARPDDFALDKAAVTDRLGSNCPAGYDPLNFRKVDAADVKGSTYTVRIDPRGLSAR